MSIAVRIRTWLESQRDGDGFRACSLSDISRGLGEPDDDAGRKHFRLELGWSIAQQVLVGNIASQPMHAKKYLYTFIRHPSKQRMDPEVRRQRKNAQARKKWAETHNGVTGRTWEQYLADVRARSAANAENRKAREKAYADKASARKREQRAAARAAMGLPSKGTKKPKPAPAPKSRPVYVIPPAYNAPAPPKVEHESVEAFLARGGNIQTLSVGEVSHPMRRIGWQPPANRQQRKKAA